jgi:hypothetical protein
VHGSAQAAHRHEARAAHAHGQDEAAAHPHEHAEATTRGAGSTAGKGPGHAEATARGAGKGHGHSEPGVPEKQPGHEPDGHQHLTGSVEHLSGLVSAWVRAEPPRVRWVSWLAERLAGPSRAPGMAPRPTAMPQGP